MTITAKSSSLRLSYHDSVDLMFNSALSSNTELLSAPGKIHTNLKLHELLKITCLRLVRTTEILRCLSAFILHYCLPAVTRRLLNKS